MVAALDSSAGSTAQVSLAAFPAAPLPALSSPASRPPLVRLVARWLSSSPVQGPWSGESISGQIQAMLSRGGCCCLAVGQYGRKVRLVPCRSRRYQ